MRIVEFESEAIGEIAFLNAGRRPNQFFRDTLSVFHGRLEHLPESLDAVVVTADLQGRELPGARNGSPQDGLRLLNLPIAFTAIRFRRLIEVTEAVIGAVNGSWPAIPES